MPDHPASQGEGLARKPGHIDVDILCGQCAVPIKDVQMQGSGGTIVDDDLLGGRRYVTGEHVVDVLAQPEGCQSMGFRCPT